MSSKVVVIDYGSGNLRSAAKALECAALELGKTISVQISSDVNDIRSAERIILPGVGAFGDCRSALDAIPDMVDGLHEFAIAQKKPFLGICVGMQLLAERGLEHGVHKGLGWFKGIVRPISPKNRGLKIPHMGWNSLELTQEGERHPLLQHIKSAQHMYFVHSYALDGDEKDVLAQTDYGGPLTAMITKENIAGVQFHPEKSQSVGLRLLMNFLNWQP